jgi:hypothetical protein
MKSNATLTPKPDNPLWGIYHADLKHAGELGDPLCTVIEARTRQAAKEAALRLGFGDPRVHPVTPEKAAQAQWLPIHHGSRQRTRLVVKPSRRIRI